MCVYIYTYSYSFAQSCLTLHDPMDCSMISFPVLHYLSVCSNSCPLNWWYHPTISYSDVPFSSCLQSFPTSGSFPMNGLFTSGGQSIGASASASILPRNIQGWCPLGLTGLICLLSKGLSRVFSNTTVQRQNKITVQSSCSGTIQTWVKSQFFQETAT